MCPYLTLLLLLPRASEVNADMLAAGLMCVSPCYLDDWLLQLSPLVSHRCCCCCCCLLLRRWIAAMLAAGLTYEFSSYLFDWLAQYAALSQTAAAAAASCSTGGLLLCWLLVQGPPVGYPLAFLSDGTPCILTSHCCCCLFPCRWIAAVLAAGEMCVSPSYLVDWLAHNVSLPYTAAAAASCSHPRSRGGGMLTCWLLG
jgi:hypothetical protein